MAEPLPIRGLHHISRVTSHLAASRAFYREVLGFEEVPRPNFDFNGAWLVNYGLQIHLIEGPQTAAETEAINTRANHIAFQVTDLGLVEERLTAQGIKYRVNFQAQNPNVKQIFFQDPDGHHVEVGAYGLA